MGQVDIIRASAGSGKTYRLAYEYVARVVDNPAALYSTLAVTFTNKATEQMKSRILKELHELSTGSGRSPFFGELQDLLWLAPEEIASKAKSALDEILHNYSFFSVYTIDSFFQKILRAFAAELSLEGDYRIELDQAYLLDMAVDALMQRAVSDDDIRTWLREYTAELVASGASYQVESAISKVASRLFNDSLDIEGFKEYRQTRIEFLKELFITAEHIYEEMRLKAIECKEAMESMGLSADDFTQKRRGLAGYILKVADGNFSAPNSYVLKATDPDSKWGGAKAMAAKESMQPLLLELCNRWNDNFRFLNSVEAIKRHWRTYVVLSDISELMDQASQSKNAMLLSKASTIITRLVEGNDAPFIYEKIGNRYTTYMIDEFQDTSLVQWNNFVPLVSDAISRGEEEHHSVLFVGDVKQSIYGWRGGDWDILQSGVARSLSTVAEEVNVETLPKNWRSDRAVVEFNNTYIRAAMEAMRRAMGELLPAEYAAQLGSIYEDMYQEPASKGGGRVEAHICDYDEQENLEIMVRHIKELQDAGCPAGDIAIIVRTNSHAESVADYLLAEKAKEQSGSYCFDIVSADALRLDSSPMVKFLISAMRLTLKEDSLSKAIVAGCLAKESITDDLEYLASLKHLSLIELLEELMIHYHADRDPSDQAYLQILYDMALEYGSREIYDARGFLRWWDESGSSRKISLPEGGDAITIITTHKSKGLEYAAVIIPYMDWSYIPRSEAVWAASDEEPFNALGSALVQYSKSLEQSSFDKSYQELTVKSIIESFNILYVALTRSCSSLMFTLPVKPRNIGVIATEALLSEQVQAMMSQIGDRESFQTSSEMPRFESHPKQETITVERFEGSSFLDQIKIHLFSKRDDSGVLSPRAEGALLHRLFESVESAEQIPAAIKGMVIDGLIDSERGEEILTKAMGQLENPLIASWFDPTAKVVRERDIILPNSMKGRNSITRRPDRVVIKDGRCAVVDYKFGSHKESYKRQLREYATLLEQMGYRVDGAYLWYFNNGEVLNCIISSG